jgi:hypothetical protein
MRFHRAEKNQHEPATTVYLNAQVTLATVFGVAPTVRGELAAAPFEIAPDQKPHALT